MKKGLVSFFCFRPQMISRKSWLKMENSMLEGDVDALYVKTEQIQQALVAKDQKLKDLGNIH